MISRMGKTGLVARSTTLLLACVLMSVAPTARAQVLGSGTPSSGGSSNPDAAAAAEGIRDGGIKGRHAGDDTGRAQALMAAWLSGYRRGLSDPIERWRLDDALSHGRIGGRPAGLEAGLADGHERGLHESQAAYAELRGRPSFRTVAPDASRPVEAAPAFSACDAPARIVVDLGRNRAVQIDPAEQDSAESPFPFEIPEPEGPTEEWLRQHARDSGAGSADNDVQHWVHAYRSAFESAWDDAFEARRIAASAAEGPRFESDGRLIGRTEGQRRASCSAFRRGHEEGWREAYEEAFLRSFREGWDESAAWHDDHAVIVLEAAELADAGADGVIEPGEDVLLELRLANAGLAPQTRPAARWRAGQSLPQADGLIGTQLAAQSHITERVPVGATDAGAPFGSAIRVEVRPDGGESQEVGGKIGRPVVLRAASAELGASGGQAAALVRVQIESVAKRPTERGLVLAAEGGDDLALGRIEPWARRTLELVRPASLAAALGGETLHGNVLLREGSGVAWMTLEWSASADMRQAVRLVAGLADPPTAIAPLKARLERELTRSVSDPKLYKKLDDSSELAQYASESRSLTGAAREALERGVTAPLLARAEDKSLPRAVRKALRNALSPR